MLFIIIFTGLCFLGCFSLTETGLASVWPAAGILSPQLEKLSSCLGFIFSTVMLLNDTAQFDKVWCLWLTEHAECTSEVDRHFCFPYVAPTCTENINKCQWTVSIETWLVQLQQGEHKVWEMRWSVISCSSMSLLWLLQLFFPYRHHLFFRFFIPACLRQFKFLVC